MPMIGLPDVQLLAREAEIEVALEIERRHAGIFGIVEPELRAQRAALRMRRFRLFAASPASCRGVFPLFLAIDQILRIQSCRLARWMPAPQCLMPPNSAPPPRARAERTAACRSACRPCR